MLGVLEAANSGGPMSQRRVAAQLDIALGLVNAYVKRCVRKGLLKVSQAPARRYAYYLTPEGFAEKSRLTAEYLTHSFSFFREARSDCSALLSHAKTAGWRRLAIAGVSDVAEVATLCAMEAELEIIGIVDTGGVPRQFVGRPVVTSYDGLVASADGILVAAIENLEGVAAEAVAAFGPDRVLIPRLLAARLMPMEGTDG